MTEQLIESAAIAAFTSALEEALGDTKFAIAGVWQTTESGVQKGREGASAVVSVGIAVGARMFETFTTPKAQMPVGVTVKVRDELDPTGEAFAAASEAVMDLLQGWQTSIADTKAAFTVSGFNPHGLRVDGGNGVTHSDGAWQLSQSFTLRGIVAAVETES